MDETMSLTMEEELIEDLKAELSIADETFDLSLLTSKVKNALREVKRVRNYPRHYKDEQIRNDLYKFYTNCRNLALYDYNQSGAEFQTSSSENGVSRGYVDRNKLFAGIVPLAKS